MPRLPLAQENGAIEYLFAPSTTYYAALFTQDPGTLGAAGEVTNSGGSAYARQSITFSAASGGVEVNTNTVAFINLPALAQGAPYIAVFTASTGGTYQGGGTNPNAAGGITLGTNMTFAIGTFQVMVT